MLLMDHPSIRGEEISDYSKNVTWNLLHAYIDTHSQRLIYDCPGDGVQAISIFQSQYENMKFAAQSRYNRMFQQVVQKGGESSINYIKIFKNAKALAVSVDNSYTEYHRMPTFLDNFQQGGKYSAQIASHQAEFRTEERIIYQKSLSISGLQIDYLDLENSVRNNEREQFD